MLKVNYFDWDIFFNIEDDILKNLGGLISNLSISFYVISTELRIMNPINLEHKLLLKSEDYINRSIEIAY